MKLKFISPYVGINNPLFHLSTVAEVWSIRNTNKDKTLNDRISYKNPKKKSVEQLERDLLLKTHAYAKDLFDQNYNDLNQRGYWRI